jgi:Zn-dependent M28 family amino/carboxypeptidase
MRLRSNADQPLRGLWFSLLIVTLSAVPIFAWQGTGTAPKPETSFSPAEFDAKSKLSVDTIKNVTTALSAPDMQGRGTGQPGADKAAKYLADYFAKLGLRPIGDNGTFLQAIPFVGSVVLPDSSFVAGTASLKYGEEYVVAPPHPDEQATLKGNLIFVNYGIVSEELKRDDLANLDLKGKIVVLLSGRPKNVDQNLWGKASQTRLPNLVGKGAIGIVLVNLTSPTQPFSLVANYLTRRQVTQANAVRPTVPPTLLVSDSGAEKLFAGSGVTYAEAKAKAEAGEAASRDLEKTVSLTIKVKRDEANSSNVVGVMDGSDQALRSQAVIYTAHYDAFGIDLTGRIYPGAADNGLGVAEMMAIAESFAKMPTKPRRSVIFLAVTGEEYGEIGSSHWVHNPTWPLANVIADLNFDGIGSEVYGPVKQIVGYGAEFSGLGKILTDVVAAQGARIIPDPVPDEQVFFRSDHFSFVQGGVPALMLLGAPDGDTAIWVARARKWLETDYHSPADIVRPDWIWSGAKDIADVGLVIGMRVALASDVPKWNADSPFQRPK